MKMVRKIAEDEAEGAVELIQEMMEMSTIHAEECAKTYKELYEDEQEYQDYFQRNKNYFQKFTPRSGAVGGRLFRIGGAR